MRLTPTQRAEVLHVAREHGTTVAARWLGMSPEALVRLRKKHDGYTRGRGRPNRSEVEAMAVRDDCRCPRCRAARGINAPALTPEQQAMVAANLGLVGFVLRKWASAVPESQYQDAWQDGLLGLMRAVQKFDPSKGFRFATYAVPWIRQGIQRGIGNLEGRSYRSADRGETGLQWQRPTSLDAPIGDDAETDTLASFLEDQRPAPDRQALAVAQLGEVANVLRSITRNRLEQAIAHELLRSSELSWSKRDEALAARLQVTREHVRRTRLQLQERLRDHFDDDYLEEAG